MSQRQAAVAEQLVISLTLTIGLAVSFRYRFGAVTKSAVLVSCALMGRANQFNSGGGIFHVTHRCHNRAFLLKFARDRDAYRAILREQLEEFEVWLLRGTEYGWARRSKMERKGRVKNPWVRQRLKAKSRWKIPPA